MRITAGTYRGRKLSCPQGIIRPAMSRMRESLFSILGNIAGCSWLDLFTGSGLVAVEAASRGAEPVILVEKDLGKKRVIKENISFVNSKMQLHIMSSEQFIKTSKGLFDYIFLDPPFNYRDKFRLLELISQKSLLKAGGSLIIHVPSQEELAELLLEELECYDRRKYGGSQLLFYMQKAEP